MKKLLLLLLALTSVALLKAQNTQTLSGAKTIAYPQDNALILASSEINYDYYLHNNADNSIIGSPQAGTGGKLTFQTGTVSETTSYHVYAAKPSYALDFDGVDDNVNIPHTASLVFTSGITIDTWVNPTVITTNRYYDIFRKNNNYGGRILLGFQEWGTVLSFGFDTAVDGYQELDVTITPANYINQWMHILVYYDDATNTAKVYRDGIEIGSASRDGIVTPPTIPTSGIIGGTELYRGKVASLRLWDKALTTSEERAYAQNNFLTGNEANLKAYYPFYENTGTQLNDVTVNANNGTFGGTPQWVTGTTGGVGKIVSNTQTITVSIAPESSQEKNYLRVAKRHITPLTVNTGGTITSTVAIDLDMDGDMDMVYADGDDGVVSWEENDGAQNYTQHTLLLYSQLVAQISVDDLDLDGDLDILIGGHHSDSTQLRWLINDGNEIFTVSLISSTTEHAFWEVADMDSDGDNDIITVQRPNGITNWYENDGSQNFTEHLIDNTAAEPLMVRAVDMDDDGDMDAVVVSKSDNKVIWYENDGSENFTTNTISTTDANVNSVFVVDFEGDGDLDVFTASGNAINWYKNDGSENFSTVLIASESEVNSIRLSDLDNDGDLDILTSDHGVKWFENDNNITFIKRDLICCLDQPFYDPNKISIADRDNDGDLDVLTAAKVYNSGFPNGLIWLEMDAMITSTSPAMNEQNDAVSSNIILDFAEAIDGATVNTNNIVISGSVSGKIAGAFMGGGTSTIIFNPTYDFKNGEIIHVDINSNVKNTEGVNILGQHNYNFRVAAVSYGFTPGSYTKHIISSTAASTQTNLPIDMDDDGDVDVLFTNGNDIIWNENDGALNFTQHTIVTSGGTPYKVYAIDLDLDGDMDVVSIERSTERTSWFENDGNQNFTTHLLPLIPSKSFISGLHPSDFDGDGDVDIVVSYALEKGIFLFENDGSQNFTFQLKEEIEAMQMRGADIDLDGDIDIITNVKTNTDPNLVWYENDGALNGKLHTISTTPKLSLNFTVDLDGDGDMDVIAGGDFQLEWNENDGNQNFTTHVLELGTFSWGYIDAMDMDGDLDIDIIVAAGTGNSVYWFKNDGNQNFTKNVIDTFNDCRTVYAVDMDNDGDMDVMSSSRNTGEVVWYEFGFLACTSTTIWDGTSWDNGTPDNSTEAIINGDYDTTVTGLSIDACEIIINDGFILTIATGDFLKTESDITVEGSLIVENGGSVVQVVDLATVTKGISGFISVEKITPVLTDRDFTIMSSPMSGETREGVYTTASLVRHHITENFVPHPQVTIDDPDAENFADDNGDNWLTHTGTINVGEGYLVKPFAIGESSGAYVTNYTQGTLNNGVVTFNTIFGDDQNDSPNILGNPYASAINAAVFITNNVIVDAIYYWEHITSPSVSYPGYNSLNYDMGDISMYNLSGGMAAANTGGGAQATNQFMPSGQGFGIKANAVGTVTFNNSMRLTDNNSNYRNSESIERLYLSISNETYGLKGSTLVAFTERATDIYDSNYDSKRLATPISLYSIVNDKELGIQGRTVFNTDQLIPLGFSTHVEENQEYTISISSVEGELISDTTVYLIDKELEIITNLSDTDYSFMSIEGHQTNRFVVVFEEIQLGINNQNINSISIYPNPTKDLLNIVSPLIGITNIDVFDLLGRMMKSIQINNQGNYQLDMSELETSMYFVMINTNEGSITKRVIKE